MSFNQTSSRRWTALAICAAGIAVACGRVSGNGPPPGEGGVGLVLPAEQFLRVSTVDKLDLLLAIDNSASMGDKQELLAEAVPDLLDRLVTPNCVADDDKTRMTGVSANGECPAGSHPEFPPVHDMHIGIVSSSLGGRGGDQCLPGQGDHNDDRGHLLNRAKKTETIVSNAAPSNFLAWLPQDSKNTGKPRDRDTVGATPYETLDPMKSDFTDLIIGVKENGCGYEAQLESAYRFLVQPDPYLQIVKMGTDGPVTYDGYDFELLKQRADFLRPDSLLAIIMVTDENESSVAPTAFGGRAWFFEDQKNVKPGTSPCATNPNDPACGSCYLAPNAGDPSCSKVLDATTDHPNVRFFHMKERFGVDPRFPIERYTRGFSRQQVPDRSSEYDGFDYIGDRTDLAKVHFCRNPIFAARLPQQAGDDLCALPTGPRTPDLVYFALIGGVPWQLLTETPADLSSNYNGRVFKERLTEADYERLLGADPFKYQFEGQHPLMRESIGARAGVGADGAHDREWDTRNKDLQYACTFELPTPKNCASTDPLVRAGCDCDQATDSPLCDRSIPTLQVRGKAYPTISQLAVAKSLKDQAIVASICPPEPKNKTSELYGYRQAVRGIIGGFKRSLAPLCMPEKMDVDAAGKNPCIMLETFEGKLDCASKGLVDPPAAVRDSVIRSRKQQGDATNEATICQAPQILPKDFVGGSCVNSDATGWCYVEGAAAGNSCAQAIRFSAGGNPVGARVSLQCF